jgi:tetratricopeptide (TPR) repeat protein
MAAKKWTAFPHDAKAFTYEGAALKKAWNRLHGGDGMIFPDAKKIQTLIDSNAALKKVMKGDGKAIAAELENGWRAFHAGDFQAATKSGEACGAFGAALASKASGIYASALCEDEAQSLSLLQAGAERCEAAQSLLSDDPNVFYFHAFALGRYSQGISITKALAQGLGGKIKASLKAALEMDPKHAEAHIAFAMYHAEIISKIGGMIGKLTYGASADEAMKHFETAKKLTPSAPIVHLEMGRGLLLLNAKKNADAAKTAFQAAIKCKPANAMEQLDIDAAQAELEG